MYVKKSAEKTFVQKFCTYNVDEIDIRFQFHKHLVSSFFCTKVFCAAFLYLQFGFVIFCPKIVGAKAAQKCW